MEEKEKEEEEEEEGKQPRHPPGQVIIPITPPSGP